MQFSIVREQLLKALKAAAGVVERRQQTAPLLANVLFRVTENTLLVAATDQEVAVTYLVEVQGVEAGGAALLPFKKINDICRTLPEHALITLKFAKSRATIIAGSSKFVLAALPADEFPKIEATAGDVKIVLARKMLLELIERTAFAMAEEDVRYFLNGLLVEGRGTKLRAVAADGHRLATHAVNLPNALKIPIEIIIPRKGVLEILRALHHDGPENVSFVIGERHVRLCCGELELSSRLYDGKFPNYQQVIPRGGDKVMIGNREALKEAFQRAAALLSEKVRGIRLKLEQGGNSLKIFANNAEHDEAEEELAVGYEGAALEIGFNVRYLLDFLHNSSAEQVKLTFSDPHSSALLEEQRAESTEHAENSGGADKGMHMYVIMPMRT